VLFDSSFCNPEALRDTAIGTSLGHEREHLTLPGGQLLQWVTSRAVGDEFLHERGVDDCAASSDPFQRIDQVSNLLDPVLEEVSDAFAAVEDVHRSFRLDMRREQQNPRFGELFADRAGGVKALERMRRRHPDVDDREIGHVVAHERQKSRCVTGLADDVVPGSTQEARNPFAQENVIVRQDNPSRRHAGPELTPRRLPNGCRLIENCAIPAMSPLTNRSSEGTDTESGRARPAVPELGQEPELARTSQAIAARAAAYFDAALDCVIMADADGRVVEFNPAAERTFGYSREEALGQTLAELIVPPKLRESHSRAFSRFVETGEGRLIGRRLELTGMRADGSEFPVELALSRVEGEPLLICGALRDISEAKKAADDLRLLVEEQEALRRVATLVAREPMPSEVFTAVAEEAAKLLQSPLVSMVRYETDGTATVIASLDEINFPVGSNWAPEGPTIITSVLQTGRAARVDSYEEITGALAARIRDAGINSAVGVPITVDRKTWGAMIAVSPGSEPLPDETEARLSRFTELVAAAISNAQARGDLRRLADEQAALRRIAMLVAREARPAEVFAAVAREVGGLLGGTMIEIVRCDPQRRATGVGAWGDHPFIVGSRWVLDGPSVIAAVLDSGRPARIDDYTGLPGSIAAFAREAGFRCAVGAPIVVDGKTWGVISAISREPEPLPPDTETRLASFTELLATAISNADARDELRRSEERYRRTIAQAGAVPYALDYASGTYSFIGEGIEELTGYTPGELDHELFGSLVLETHLHGEQAGLPDREASHRTRAGEFGRWHADLRIKRRDGEIRWLTDASVEIAGEDGRSVGSVGLLQDVTERIKHEEERLRLATILEATTDFVGIADPRGQLLYINRAGRAMLGIGENEDISAITAFDIQGLKAADQFRDRVATAVRNGVWSGDNDFRARDGHEIPVSQVILAHKDPRGVVTFFSTIARDLTQARELDAQLRSAQHEQAALRRVATLIAQQAAPHEVFAAVAEEAGRLLGSDATNLTRYEADGTATIIGGWSPDGLRHHPEGARGRLDPTSVTARVFASGRPVRLDSDEDLPGPITAATGSLGFRTALAAPIIVNGRLWGVLAASATAANPLSADAERRITAFADLVGTAVANAEARTELSASRARILAAGDEARRRIERDLHDGTQQQLVTLGIALRELQGKLPGELREAHQDLMRIDQALDRVLDDVREISRGVHPAVLSQWGLDRALRGLARRSPIPVDLELDVGDRLPESIEITAYYVVSEALANVTKHAKASGASVTARVSGGRLRVTVRDDGVGGANAVAGSGLAGLVDRVEAGGGQFVVESPPGKGTTISIELPLVPTSRGEAAGPVIGS
jgi:PAS domain S-box-containing protein